MSFIRGSTVLVIAMCVQEYGKQGDKAASPQVAAQLKEETDRLARIHGNGNLEQFPEFNFDPKV